MTQSSASLPLLTFNSLYNILREEKKNSGLQKLDESFYPALKKFLTDKKEEVKKAKDESDLEKARKEKNTLVNAQKITEELLNIRCMKIANIGIKNELFGEEILPQKNVLEEELSFLKKLRGAVKELQLTINEK